MMKQFVCVVLLGVGALAISGCTVYEDEPDAPDTTIINPPDQPDVVINPPD